MVDVFSLFTSFEVFLNILPWLMLIGIIGLVGLLLIFRKQFAAGIGASVIAIVVFLLVFTTLGQTIIQAVAPQPTVHLLDTAETCFLIYSFRTWYVELENPTKDTQIVTVIYKVRGAGPLFNTQYDFFKDYILAPGASLRVTYTANTASCGGTMGVRASGALVI